MRTPAGPSSQGARRARRRRKHTQAGRPARVEARPLCPSVARVIMANVITPIAQTAQTCPAITARSERGEDERRRRSPLRQSARSRLPSPPNGRALRPNCAPCSSSYDCERRHSRRTTGLLNRKPIDISLGETIMITKFAFGKEVGSVSVPSPGSLEWGKVNVRSFANGRVLARVMVAVAAFAALARPVPAFADCYAVVEQAYYNCKAGELYNSYGHCENRRAQGLVDCKNGANYRSARDIFNNPHDECLKRANNFHMRCNTNSCMPMYLDMLNRCG